MKSGGDGFEFGEVGVEKLVAFRGSKRSGQEGNRGLFFGERSFLVSQEKLGDLEGGFFVFLTEKIEGDDTDFNLRDLQGGDEVGFQFGMVLSAESAESFDSKFGERKIILCDRNEGFARDLDGQGAGEAHALALDVLTFVGEELFELSGDGLSGDGGISFFEWTIAADHSVELCWFRPFCEGIERLELERLRNIGAGGESCDALCGFGCAKMKAGIDSAANERFVVDP